MKNNYKIAKLIQTCAACPSQWEGHLDDGRMVYIRYRHGTLRANISTIVTDDVSKALDETSNTVFSEVIGGCFDGDICLESMKIYLKNVFDFEDTI